MATDRIRSRPIESSRPLGSADQAPVAPRRGPDSFSRASTTTLQGIVRAGSGIFGAARMLARDPGEAIVRDIGVRNMEFNVANRGQTVMRIADYLGGSD